MIIRSMRADFGRLEGETLELGPGLNVIKRPNESGKSTWCAFIRAMLYGIDTGERAKSGFLPDKLRYLPWSGRPMSGSMEIEYAGRAVTLTRSTRTYSAPMREFSAVYTGTAEPVPGLTGATAGETLTGAGREVFRRSAFIGQGEAEVTGTAELERRIAAVVTTGEEDTSCSEALSRLKAWQNRRRSPRRTGLIPELESELAAQQRQLEDISGLARRRDELESELRLARSQAESARRSEAELTELARRELLDAAERAGEEVQRLEAAHSAAVAEAARRRVEADTGPFSGLEPGEAMDRAEAAAERCGQLGEAAGASVSRLGAYISAGACLLCLGLAFLSLYALAGAALFAALAVWRFSVSAKAASQAREAGAERSRLLGSFGARDEQELLGLAKEHALLCRDAEKAEGAERRAASALAEARAKRREAESRLLRGPERQDRGAAALEQRCDRLGTSLAELSGKIAATGDPLVLKSGILERREHIAGLESQCEAIALAAQTLKEADAQLQSRFSPALGRRAAQYLSRMTGGLYTEVAVARDFSVLLRQKGENVQRQALYLSAGAADLTYLAVRLAIVDLTLPQEEPCPIVLDDALVNLDSKRRRAAMELLGEIAQKRQVILFTCD